MPTERIETGEILKQRHAYYQVIGPIGVGKSTFVDAFTADTKSEKSPESHTIIDGLKEFYTLDPAHYSFWVQSQFLDVDTNKLQPIAAILENQSLAQDGGRYQDFVLATLQRKMGWMSAHEYDGMYIPKYRKPVILEPDAIIYFRASVEKCIQGILKRGRSEEIDFLKRHPEYFEAIPGAFDTWVGANKDKTTIITVDITDMDIAESGDDRTKAIREVKDKLAPIIGKLRGKVFFPEHLSKFPHLALELSSRVEFFRACIADLNQLNFKI